MSGRREFVSPVVGAIPPSGIRRFFDLIAKSTDVISLGVGEPDFHTPWHIREAGIYSLEQGITTYTSNAGLPELRHEIAAYLERTQGLRYDPDRQILVTVGVAEAIDLALRATTAPGDEVLVPEPCFVSYAPCALLAGARVVPVPLDPDHGFRLRPADLVPRLTVRSKSVVVGYPNNPTGAVMSRSDWEPVAALAQERDLLLISDEIYGELTYGSEHVSPASLPGMAERTLILNGFSKAFAMTGWRIGFAAGPEPVIAAMTKIHQHTIMCAPTTAQIAAIEALRFGRDASRQMAHEYDRRRRLIVAGLRAAGLDCREPEGAFYAFPSVASTGLSSEEFATALLSEEKVAVVPGNAFGQSGEGFVRCAYACSLEKLEIALERIGRFVRRRVPANTG